LKLPDAIDFETAASMMLRGLTVQRYALRDVAQAHRDLEARRTTGSSLLVP